MGSALRHSRDAVIGPCRILPRPMDVKCCAKPVGAPFPYVSADVVQPIAIGLERFCGRCSKVPIRSVVRLRKLTLPNVAHMLSVWRQFVSPGKLPPLQSAPGGVFPFRFCRQPLACPVAIGHRVIPGYVNHWMVHSIRDVGVRPVWMPPICSVHAPPPRSILNDLAHAL